MELFEDLTTPEQVLLTAYSLEEGLKDFYLKMIEKVTSTSVIDLFNKLAHVEDIHKKRLFDEYARLTGSFDQDAFMAKLKMESGEGGLTTEEYLDRFHPDLEKVEEVISLAMSIEAQALDLYSRAARVTEDKNNKNLLNRIADEEKIHLEQLGILLDQAMGEKYV